MELDGGSSPHISGQPEEESAPEQNTARLFALRYSWWRWLVVAALLAFAGIGIEAAITKENPFAQFITLLERNNFHGSVIAIINGEKVYQNLFDARVQQASLDFAANGKNVQDPMVIEEIRAAALETLIGQRLLLQDAIKKGFSVSDEEVATEYQKVVDQLGGEEELENRLREKSFTEKDLRQNLREQLTFLRYLEEETREQARVSPEEVEAFYAEYRAQTGNAEELTDALRLAIEKEIRDRKLLKIINNRVTELKQDAKIQILM